MAKLTRLALAFILLLSASFGFAQTNFVDGSIIKNNGDTIKGQIDYQEWEVNPKKIGFRADKNSKSEQYSIDDIAGFKINYKNEYYRRAEVDVNYEPIDARDLRVFETMDSINNDFKLKKDTALLLIVTEGYLTLYQLCDEKHKYHYFIQKDKGKIEELIYRKVKIVNRDSVQVMNLLNYISQLRQIVADCPKKIDILKGMPYQQPDMISIVKKYNDAKGVKSYVKQRDAERLNLLIMTSAVQPFFKVQYYYDLYTARTTRPGKIAPSFGLGFDVGYGRLRDRFGIGVDAFLSSYKTQFTQNDVVYERKLDFKIAMTALRFNLSARYAFSTNTIKPYFRAGLGLTKYLKANFSRIATNKDQTTNFAEGELDKTEINYMLALGAKSKQFFVETRFEEWPVGQIDPFASLIKTKRLSLIAGYSLNLNKKAK